MKLLYCLIIIAIVTSCAPESEFNVLESYNYFPMAKGEERTYEWIKTNWAVGVASKPDTVLVKEIVTDQTEENLEKTYTIQRLIKGKNDFFFKPILTFQYLVSPREVVTTEQNIQIVELQFPLTTGSAWDQNRLNIEDPAEAEIVETFELPEKLFTKDKIKIINLFNEDSQVSTHIKNKYYAKDIGLIYTENTAIEYCQKDGVFCGKNGERIKDSGVIETLRLIEYKKANN